MSWDVHIIEVYGTMAAMATSVTCPDMDAASGCVAYAAKSASAGFRCDSVGLRGVKGKPARTHFEGLSQNAICNPQHQQSPFEFNQIASDKEAPKGCGATAVKVSVKGTISMAQLGSLTMAEPLANRGQEIRAGHGLLVEGQAQRFSCDEHEALTINDRAISTLNRRMA